jgi:hypothetical protein
LISGRNNRIPDLCRRNVKSLSAFIYRVCNLGRVPRTTMEPVGTGDAVNGIASRISMASGAYGSTGSTPNSQQFGDCPLSKTA